MKFPNKVVSYNESVFPIIIEIVTQLKQNSATVMDVCLKAKERGIDISESFQALDVLFALGKISFDEETEVIRYVG